MGRKLKKRSLFNILAGALGIIAAVACGSRGSGSKALQGIITNYTECVPHADQEGSLKGSWQTPPIKIVLDRDFYVTNGGTQATAIKKAIATWNGWSQLKGFNIFELQDDGSGSSAGRYFPEFDDSAGCDTALFTGAATDGVVGIWKVRSGGDGRNSRGSCKLLPTNVQGLTDWYTEDGFTTRAMILLNFDDFNVPGKPTLDIESLALHELGHVIGLYHSCRNTGEDGTGALCYDDAGNNIAGVRYAEAVMFPKLINSQIRRNLKQNDYDRVNCLY